MYGRNTGNLATIRIRQEFVLREFELSGMHCIYKKHIYIYIYHRVGIDSINRDERGFPLSNTLQIGEYLALGKL